MIDHRHCPFQDVDQYNRTVAFYYVKHGRGDPGDLTEALRIEISHRDPFQLITDLDSLICDHEVPCMSLLKLGKAVDDGTPGYAYDQ